MSITIEQSGAFVETFELQPGSDGPLAGLRFGVKDLIDIAGRKTGCGNPSWRDTHPPARSHAVVIDQLLAAGGQCIGKTVSDELAFSLIGENHFYGTPLNPRAPNRVPGGSSSGSVSAVACGLADFALGSDTGGSVRVPASNCGVWGLRPSHDFISVAGAMPFAPTFDTVGIHARNAEILARAAGVLLGALAPANSQSHVSAPAKPKTIHLLKEAFQLAEPAVQQAHQQALEKLRKQFGPAVRETSLAEIAGNTEPGPASFDPWFETYCVMQWAEIENSLGPWIAECKPTFGPVTTKNFELVKSLDRRRVPSAIVRREKFYRAMQKFLGAADLLCIPTTPAPAPVKQSLGMDQRVGDYYKRALSLTSIAGICRLPQVSLPLSMVTVEGGELPLGLSLLARFGEDLFLLDVVQQIAKDHHVT
ncbi:MAG TPA: amidase [Pirellulales bacterium]|jgi:amidase|nr:amidase [Pirellulales bacterium]